MSPEHRLYINRQNYKKQRNHCVKLRDKAIKNDFDKAFSNIKSNSKPFYDLIKPYLTNKGALCSTDINLIENGKIVTDDVELGNIFNDYYTNIVYYSSGCPPANIADTLPSGTKSEIIIEQIIEEFKDHPSIKCI